MSFESFPKPEEQPAESSTEIDSAKIARELDEAAREREKIIHGRYADVLEARKAKALAEEESQRIKAVEEEISKLTPEERRRMLAELGLPENAWPTDVLYRRQAKEIEKENEERKRKRREENK